MNLLDLVKKLEKDVSELTKLVMNIRATTGGGVVDHTHQASGQGGKVDHGLALNGLTDDDHTYVLAAGTKKLSADWNAGAAEGRTIQAGSVVAGAAVTAQENLQSEGRLALKETTDPTSDAGYGKLWTSSADSVLYFMDGGGTIYDLLSGGVSSPSMPRFNIKLWKAIVASNVSWEGIGVLPNLVAVGSASNLIDADGMWVLDATSNVTGNIASLRCTGTAQFWPSHNPYMYFHIKTPSSIASRRYWLGCLAGTGSFPRSSDMGTQGVGFRYDTTVPDTNWQFCTRDSGGTQSVSDTGVAVTADTVYRMQAYTTDGGTTWYWDINGTGGSKATNVPSDVDMGPQITWITETTSQMGLYIAYFYWLQEYT